MCMCFSKKNFVYLNKLFKHSTGKGIIMGSFLALAIVFVYRKR